QNDEDDGPRDDRKAERKASESRRQPRHDPSTTRKFALICGGSPQTQSPLFMQLRPHPTFFPNRQQYRSNHRSAMRVRNGLLKMRAAP
ncbi:MAG TPA: hypothetical protein VH858_15800, partial [Hyphomicrobiales bacterium]